MGEGEGGRVVALAWSSELAMVASLCDFVSTHARNPTSSRTKSSSAPKATGDAYDYYQRAHNPSKL